MSVRIYRADYYGRGAKLYMERFPLFQTAHDAAPRRMPGGSSEGHVLAIRRAAARHGICL